MQYSTRSFAMWGEWVQLIEHDFLSYTSGLWATGKQVGWSVTKLVSPSSSSPPSPISEIAITILSTMLMMRMMIIRTPEGSQGAETKAHFFHPWVRGTGVGGTGVLVGLVRNARQCNAMDRSGINLTGLWKRISIQMSSGLITTAPTKHNSLQKLFLLRW